MMENTLPASRFRFGASLFTPAHGERIVLPFRRSTMAMLIVAVMAIVMTVPAVSVFRQAAAHWGQLDDLFDLTGALFSTGWLMGWSVGLLLLYAILIVLAFGREILVLRPGLVEIRLGLPALFMGIELDPDRITNLHHRQPEAGSGKAWRGPHLAFEYEGAALEVGSDLSEARAMQLAARIHALPVAAGEQNAAAPESSSTIPPADVHPPATVPVPTLTSIPALALIAANLLPVLGVLLFGWDLGAIMVLFWAESGIIGFYHLLKVFVIRRWLALFVAPLFIGHFGAFMAVHFLFVYGIFVEGFDNHGPGDSLAEVGQLFIGLWPALLALFTSHGISFFINFLGRQEYRHMSAREQMSDPYRRIVIMHLAIIIGGGLSLVLGTPLAALVLLILLKAGLDLQAHQKQRLHDKAG